MKSTVSQTLRITGICLIVLTVLFITGFVAAWLKIRSQSESTAIIGGADRPTAILIMSRYGWIPLLAGAVLIAGIVCIIVSVVIHKKNKQR